MTKIKGPATTPDPFLVNKNNTQKTPYGVFCVIRNRC
jgi:hypothetical protein